MKIKEITDFVDKVYVIEDEEGKWLFTLFEYEGELIVARCLKNE